MAARQPDRAALKIPCGRTPRGDIDYLTLSFAELNTEVDAWSTRLARAGVRRGDRTLVMVKQGLPLIASAFALFKLGAVPIIIDPGMGLRNFLRCVERSRPRALVGIPLAQLVSRVFGRPFSTVAARVTASSSLTARLTTSIPPLSVLGSQLAQSAPTDLAAVLFTSGSTGAPKGVCYEHGMFDAQIRLIRDTYAIEPGEVDLPMLPIFALFNPALGMTTIVPEIDPRRPATVDPRKIVQAITQENVTNSFGSPTLWRKIGDHCIAHQITLPSLRRVLCAGAPVPETLWQSSRTWMPRGGLHSPYGATEALPVTTISSDEIAALSVASVSSSAFGSCVGRPIAGNQLKIITIVDQPIESLDDIRELPNGEIGEIIVAGPTVTRTYDAAPEATSLAKIEMPNAKCQAPARPVGASDTSENWSVEFGVSAPRGTVWHRMGDCGYLDPQGRLWFCGRKVERVETAQGTLFTEPCEQAFRCHPHVTRCALIGLGKPGQQRPAIVVEAGPGNSNTYPGFARELRALALRQPHTAGITLFYFHPKFPVDVRHNAKIHRLALAHWAISVQGFEG